MKFFFQDIWLQVNLFIWKIHDVNFVEYISDCTRFLWV